MIFVFKINSESGPYSSDFTIQFIFSTFSWNLENFKISLEVLWNLKTALWQFSNYPTSTILRKIANVMRPVCNKTIKVSSSRAAHTDTSCNPSSPHAATKQGDAMASVLCASHVESLPIKSLLSMPWKMTESYFKPGHHYQPHLCWPVTAALRYQQRDLRLTHCWSLLEPLPEAVRTLQLVVIAGLLVLLPRLPLETRLIPSVTDTGQTAVQWQLAPRAVAPGLHRPWRKSHRQ